MKKLQNYLMKPEELRKKLQNPRFRQDFVDWTKNNISVTRQNVSRQSRSRSPVQRLQHSLHLNSKKNILNNKENIRGQSGLKGANSAQRTTQRTPLTQKVNHGDQQNRNISSIKRNISNGTLTKGNEQRRGNPQSLNNKNRYSSCASIDNRRDRSISHGVSIEQKKIKQKYSYRTRQGVQISNPNKVNQDSLVIKTNLADKKINLYAVADGHGAFGHQVSQYLVKNVTKMFEN